METLVAVRLNGEKLDFSEFLPIARHCGKPIAAVGVNKEKLREIEFLFLVPWY